MHRFLLCFLLLAVHQATLPASAQGPQEQLCRALSGYVAAHPNCKVHSNCREVECTNAGLVLHRATLSVHNCEDPVQLDLRVVADSFNWTHSFSITGEQSRCVLDMSATVSLIATYSRNTSHLQVEAHAIVEGDIALPLIPAISIPLNLRNCTCSDLEDAHDHFQFPVPGVTHECSVDNTTCTDFMCKLDYGSTHLNSDNVIDPCSESLTVTATDAVTGRQVFHQVFSQSRGMQFDVENYTPTVYVLINHYAYSMTISVLMNILSTNVTLLAEETIVLDRSSCSNVNRFPAAPLPSGSTRECSSGLITGGTPGITGGTPGITGGTPGTTAQSANATDKAGLSLGVIVAVPVSLTLVALTVCIAVGFCLALFYMRKKREVRFRRVAFERMDDDDDDMI